MSALQEILRMNASSLATSSSDTVYKNVNMNGPAAYQNDSAGLTLGSPFPDYSSQRGIEQKNAPQLNNFIDYSSTINSIASKKKVYPKACPKSKKKHFMPDYTGEDEHLDKGSLGSVDAVRNLKFSPFRKQDFSRSSYSDVSSEKGREQTIVSSSHLLNNFNGDVSKVNNITLKTKACPKSKKKSLMQDFAGNGNKINLLGFAGSVDANKNLDCSAPHGTFRMEGLSPCSSVFDVPSSEKTTKQTSVEQLSHFKDYLSKENVTSNEKPTKKSYPKACPKSRKKFLDEDKKEDLPGIPDKNLNTDSNTLLRKWEMSLCSKFPDFSPRSRQTVMSSTQQLRHFNDCLSKVNEKPKKRSYPGVFPNFQKKCRMQDVIDNAVLKFAGPINTDKNLDSDSSDDVIIIDDTVIIKDECGDLNTQCTSSNNVLNAFSESSSRNSSEHFSVKTSENGSVQHLTSIMKERKKNDKKSAENNFSVSILKNNSNSLPLFPNSLPTQCRNNKRFFSVLLKKNCSESVSGCCLTQDVNVCKPSTYASKRLDNGRDNSQTPSGTPNYISKETNQSKLEIVCDPPDVQIKTEVTECNIKSAIGTKNESLVSDGIHVSMTFEAEPSCEEDDGPVAFCDNFELVDLVDSPVKSRPIDLKSDKKTDKINSVGSNSSTNCDIQVDLLGSREKSGLANFKSDQKTEISNMSHSGANSDIQVVLLDSPVKSGPADMQSDHETAKMNYVTNSSTNGDLQVDLLDPQVKSGPADLKSNRKSVKINDNVSSNTISDFNPSVIKRASIKDVSSKSVETESISSDTRANGSSSEFSTSPTLASASTKLGTNSSRKKGKKNRTVKTKKRPEPNNVPNKLSSDIHNVPTSGGRVSAAELKRLTSTLSDRLTSTTELRRVTNNSLSSELTLPEQSTSTLFGRLSASTESRRLTNNSLAAALTPTKKRSSTGGRRCASNELQRLTNNPLSTEFNVSETSTSPKTSKKAKQKTNKKKTKAKASSKNINRTCNEANYQIDNLRDLDDDYMDSSNSEALNLTSKNKGKGKNVKGAKVDENLPTTFLLKKQKHGVTKKNSNGKSITVRKSKQVCADLSSEEESVEESMSTIDFQEDLEDTSSNSDSDIRTGTDSTPNTKKRRARPNEYKKRSLWCKKKTTPRKNKKKALSVATSIQNADSNMNLLTDKQPVVIVEDLKSIYAVDYDTLLYNICLQKDAAISSGDRKGRNCKTTKTKQVNDYSCNKESSSKQSECNNMNNEGIRVQRKESNSSGQNGSVKECVNESNNRMPSAGSSCEPAPGSSVENVIVNGSVMESILVRDRPSRKSRLCCSINIHEVAQDIAKLQARIEEQQENEVLHSNLVQESVSENSSAQHETLDKRPSDSDAAHINADTNKALKSKNNLQQGIGIKIKEEIIDIDSNTSGCKPDHSQQSSLNTRNDSLTANVQSNSACLLPKKPIECMDNTVHEVIDLTDDDDQLHSALNKTAAYHNITSATNQFIQFNRSIKIEKDSESTSVTPCGGINEVSRPVVAERGNSTFSFGKNDSSGQVDTSKVGTNVSSSEQMNEATGFDKNTRRETSNTFIVRDKYIDEYFKHPFPASLPLYHAKQRNRNKAYTRIDSKAWNLPKEQVASRLQQAQASLPQFGKLLGDVIKLDKHAVSPGEIECYHRILGVAPSQRLLSKYYAGKKMPTMINELIKCKPPIGLTQLQTTANQTSCTIQDILQGITESKMMCSNTNAEIESHPVFRDQSSIAVNGGLNSGVSSVTNFVNVHQNKDATTSHMLPVQQNQFSSLSVDASLNAPNSSLNCAPAVMDTSDSCPSSQYRYSLDSNVNANFSLLQRDVSSNLPVPAKEFIADSLPNTSRTITGIIPSSFTGSRNFISSDPLPSSENLAQMDSGLVSDLNPNESLTLLSVNQATDVINLPVLELRKILETAGSLPCGSDNYGNGEFRKSAATSEHNQTPSLPVIGGNPIENTDSKNTSDINPDANEDAQMEIENESSDEYVEAEPDPRDCDNSEDEYVDTEEIPCESQNSEDEYVDTEPIHHDCEAEKNPPAAEESSTVIPQYKSKWEKIMERKGQEIIKNDCIPVSSNLKSRGKKDNIYCEISKAPKVNLKKAEREDNSEMISKTKLQPVVVLRDCGYPSEDNNSEVDSNKQNKSLKAKTTVKQKTAGPKCSKHKVIEKPPDKSDDAILFTPDKTIKNSSLSKPDISITKSAVTKKLDEKNKPKRFYGNRVTNRGAFLAKANFSNPLKHIKIPKKKASEETDQQVNSRSGEFNSRMKYRGNNNQSQFTTSKYKKSNKLVDSRKNSEFYKSPLSDSVSSTTTHFIRTKRMRDRENFRNRRFSADHFRNGTMLSRRDAPSNSSSVRNDERLHNRRTSLEAPLLSPNEHYDADVRPRKIPRLGTSSIPSRPEHYGEGAQVPIAAKNPQSSANSMDQTMNLLKKIITVCSKSSVSDIVNMIPNSGSLNAAGSIDPKSSFGTNQLPFKQNPSSHTNVPIEPVNHPLRNVQRAGSIDLQKAAAGLHPAPNVDPRRCGNASLDHHGPPAKPFIDTVNQQTAAQVLKPNVAVGAPIPVICSRSCTPPPELLDSQPKEPVGSSIPVICSHFSTIPPADSLNSKRATPRIPSAPPSKKQKHSAKVLKIAPSSTVTQTAKKSICLVPQELKSSIGHTIVETHNVRLLILEWSVDWLSHHEKNQDPPSIINALRKVASTYKNFQDYYNTYFPLMLLDTWHRIYASWRHLNQTTPFLCQITSYSVKSNFVSVECQTMFSTDARPKGVHPDEGSILLVKYTAKSTDYNIKSLGYVTYVKTRRFNPVTDSTICSSLTTQTNVNPDSLQILTLIFTSAYNSEDVDKRQPVRIHVLCSVKHNLKQNDAMLNITTSPMAKNILNPLSDGLLTATLTSGNASEETVTENVREITKGILTLHPQPLLTIVRANHETDRLRIIPLLIKKMKNDYNYKVLLCVRNVKYLGAIAAKLISQKNPLKLVIINKRCDTSEKIHRYLLEELVSQEAIKVEGTKAGEKIHLKNETCTRLKKQVLKDCDVVLSLVRNSHDDVIQEAFSETDRIAQSCCILDEANLCTEPETLIPLMYGISKLILIGDPDCTAKVVSKTASSYDFNHSLFRRAYDLDLFTD